MSITPVFPLRKGKDLHSGLDEDIYLHEVLKCKRNEQNTKTRVQVGFEFRNQIWKYRNNLEIQKYLKNKFNTNYLFMQETNTSVQIDAFGNAKLAYDEYGTINAPDGRCKLNEMDV